MPFGFLSGVHDVITNAKFYVNRLRGLSVVSPSKCYFLYFLNDPYNSSRYIFSTLFADGDIFQKV